MKFSLFKKNLLITIAMFPLWLFGQTTLLPVLSEGKSWEVVSIDVESAYTGGGYPVDTTGYYTISVNGDTLVNSLTCKKILIAPKDEQRSSKTAVAYEQDGKVYNVNENGEMELLFDMGLKNHDVFNSGWGHVVGEGTICVNGINRKRLVIDSGADNENYLFYIVEGIGISSDEYLTVNLGVSSLYDFCCMLSCSENGEIIFTKNDFTSPLSAITTINSDKQVKSVRYYSIAGVESAEPFKGVNLKVTTWSDGSRTTEKVLK